MLQVRRLEKIIENRSALSIEALDIVPGDIVAIIGPVGNGKTLFVRTLAGMLLPSGGTVMLDGQDIYRSQPLRERISMLFEEDLLYERLSVRANLKFYRQLRNLPRNSVDEALALAGLMDQADKPVCKLSPSAQRRVAFARTIMGAPSVILLDMPTIRTDFDTRILFARLITELAVRGTAFLLTDEDVAWPGKFATKVIEMQAGRFANVYDPRVVKEQPALETEVEKDTSREERVPEKEAEAPATRLVPFKVPAKREDRIILFDPGDILYATSREGKTYLRTTTEEATTNLTLQELESRLLGRGFFKAHRAYLVNLQYIKAVIQYTRNSYTLLLSDPQESMIPLSKQCEKELQDLLRY